MAKARICTIEGCDKKHVARGWCLAHYARWKKHGDPLAGRTAEGDPLKWIRSLVEARQPDECVIWPYARKAAGYGAVLFEEHIIGAHRAVCIVAHGHPPKEELVAAHSCGRGHLGCVNPRHLRWATHLENSHDAVQHRASGVAPAKGTQKLTTAQVIEILARHGKDKIAHLAAEYGVSESMIFRIHNGERWAHLQQGLAS